MTFVSDETDAKILNSVQDRFEVNITVLPAEIDVSSYSEYYFRVKFSHPHHKSPPSLSLQLKGCEQLFL